MNNEWRDKSVTCTESLYFSNIEMPTLVDKGGAGDCLNWVLSYEFFMLCNMFFLC